MDQSLRTIHFHEDGLYVVLSHQGPDLPWHWGLYLHNRATGGWVFHIRNYVDDPTWHFEHKSSDKIMQSHKVVVALQIAVIKPDVMHEALQSFLGTTESGISMEDPNQFGPLTCRTWVLQAIHELDQSGHISIMPGYTVRDVEFEAIGVAEENSHIDKRIPDERLLRSSQYSKA